MKNIHTMSIRELRKYAQHLKDMIHNLQTQFTKITMTTITDRNPDVDLETESIPAGHYLCEGKNLMQSARYAKIPFGVAVKRRPCSNSTRKETIGLVIREEHRERMDEALAKKAAAKEYAESLRRHHTREVSKAS